MRSPLKVTLSVWKALFLREAVLRMSQDRISWLWLVVEPVAHVALMMWIYVVLRQRVVAGADTAVWIMVGVLAFFLPRNIWNRAMEGAEAGEALYAFRQVKPVDMVFVRAAVEALLLTVIFVCIFVAAGLGGVAVLPGDPLGALAALVALWFLGLGLGLVFSVFAGLVPEFGRLVRLLMLPLYLMSGVVFPLAILPPALLKVALLNPLVHGIESMRVAFMPGYQPLPGLDLAYVAQFAVVAIFLGLALQVRYRAELASR